MKITVTAPGGFLHGRERYDEGKEYDVDTALGGYFLGNGWAMSDARAAASLVRDQNVSLDIEDGVHGHAAPEVGSDG
jgi:hypothetical protein